MEGENETRKAAAFARLGHRAKGLLGLRRRERESAEERLRQAEAKYRTLVEQLPLVTYIDALTETASAIYASPQLRSLLGYTVEEWVGDPDFFPKILHPDDHERVLALVDHCNRTADPFRADYRLIAKDGRTVWVQDESLVVCDDDGTPLFTQGYLLDITDRKEAERRQSVEHGVVRVLAETATLTEAAPRLLEQVCTGLEWERGALWLLDREDDLLRPFGAWPGDASEESLRKNEGLAGRVWCRLEPIWTAESASSFYAVPVLLGAQFVGVLEFVGRGLREPDPQLAITLAAIGSQVAQFIERRQAEEQLAHQALHDSLTDLPNRRLFHDRVGHALARAERNEAPVAVLLMDLDRFKEVNDTVGHLSGDQLLRELGQRLRASLRAGDTVARLGGDEFGFVLSDFGGATIGELVERIEGVFAEPFRLQQLTLQMDASIGIAVSPEHGNTVDLLLQRADVAMYVAKRSGQGHAVYDAAKDEHTLGRLAMVGELRRALERRELVLHYQPQIRLRTGTVTSVEALVRWKHPARGLMPPDEFIPVAETSGLMEPLARYVIDDALRQCHDWRRLGHELDVAVNISTRNLIDTAFPADVQALLEKWRFPPDRLTLEITERTVLAEPFRAKAVLEELSELGLRLSIDDFGTGYSSLAYLRRLPLDEIKIDRSFIHAMTTDHENAVIVRSTIDLARNLGLEVVGEGIETAEIYETLVQLGCDAAQGFHMSPPLPPDELVGWLQRWRTGDSNERAESS